MNSDKQKLIHDFWASPNEALFNQKTLAAVVCRSTSWCEKMRWQGGGVPFTKNEKYCLYRKQDIVNWLNQFKTVKSTSEYPQEVSSADVTIREPEVLSE